MTIIKNLSKKIVHVGTAALLPGDSTKVDNKIANLPSILAMASADILMLIPVAEEAPAPVEEAPAAPEVEVPVVEPVVEDPVVSDPAVAPVSPAVAKARAARKAKAEAAPAEE